MTRSTTRVLAILLLAGSISSGVVAAPASILPPSTSSSPTLTGAHAPPFQSTTEQESSSGGSEVVPFQRPRRIIGDGDDLAVEKSAHTESGDSDLSVIVNLEKPAELSKRGRTNTLSNDYFVHNSELQDPVTVLNQVEAKLILFENNDPKSTLSLRNLASYEQSVGMALKLENPPSATTVERAQDLKARLETVREQLTEQLKGRS
ncbi:hypothetical protein C8R42DRAFT_774286 [Lentinula raphanica]|nr:hypothetical protein C8R42DRAFT_774286 [Lentinula raphanica]